MRAPEDVLDIWKTFDEFPMETLSKAWYFDQFQRPRQRSVNLMKDHRKEFGTSGNCFDLALWLIEEFSQAGIESYAIGHDLFTPDAHVAVIAILNRFKYFCDLGDLWIEPILIDPRSSSFSEDLFDLFFPAAKVRVKVNESSFQIEYVRANGKKRSQSFNLDKIPSERLWEAGEHSQNLLRKPLVERRIYCHNEVLHWEFDQYKSFISTNKELVLEEEANDIEEWISRIHDRSGINKEIIKQSLKVYSKRSPHN